MNLIFTFFFSLWVLNNIIRPLVTICCWVHGLVTKLLLVITAISDMQQKIGWSALQTKPVDIKDI